MALHADVLAEPHQDEDAAAHAAGAMAIVRWWPACDKLLLDGAANVDARWQRLDRTEFQRGAREAYLDEVIDAGRVDDRGSVPLLRALFEAALRGDDIAGVTHLREIGERFDDGRGLGETVVEVLEDRFLVSGGYRRALLALPAVARYLDTSARRGAGRLVRPETVSLEIIREDLRQPADPGPDRASALYRAVIDEFLPSLKPSMRQDFEAVRLNGERAVDVAARTGRSRAAVSKNLAQAQIRLGRFLETRG